MGEWTVEQFATIICGILSGVFVPAPQVPAQWAWLHEAIPFSHLLKAVLATTLHCDAAAGRPCDTVPILSVRGAVPVPAYAYIAGRYGLDYDGRWAHYGKAVGITAVIGFAAALALHGLRSPWTHLALRAAAKSPAVGAQ